MARRKGARGRVCGSGDVDLHGSTWENHQRCGWYAYMQTDTNTTVLTECATARGSKRSLRRGERGDVAIQRPLRPYRPQFNEQLQDSCWSRPPSVKLHGVRLVEEPELASKKE